MCRALGTLGAVLETCATEGPFMYQVAHFHKDVFRIALSTWFIITEIRPKELTQKKHFRSRSRQHHLGPFNNPLSKCIDS